MNRKTLILVLLIFFILLGAAYLRLSINGYLISEKILSKQIPLDLELNEDYNYSFEIKEKFVYLKSLDVSGSLIGNSSVNIYLLNGEKKLILDKNTILSNSTINTIQENITVNETVLNETEIIEKNETKIITEHVFENLCVETCELSEEFDQDNYIIYFEVLDAILKINEINYSIVKKVPKIEEEITENVTNVTENITNVSVPSGAEFTEQIDQGLYYEKTLEIEGSGETEIEIEIPEDLENIEILEEGIPKEFERIGKNIRLVTSLSKKTFKVKGIVPEKKIIKFDKNLYSSPPGVLFEISLYVKNPLTKKHKMDLVLPYDKIEILEIQKNGIPISFSSYSMSQDKKNKIKYKHPDNFKVIGFSEDFEPGQLINYKIIAKMPEEKGEGKFYFDLFGEFVFSVDPWWDNNWDYRKQLNITNSNSTDFLPAGFTINLTIDTQTLVTGGKMLENGSDARIAFQNSSGNYELDRLNATAFNLTNTEIFFKTQENISSSSSDTRYYLYYGNPSAGDPPTNTSKIFQKLEADSSIAGLWHIDDGSGSSTTADSSGNGNTGTLTDMNITGNATSGWTGSDGGVIDNTTYNFSEGDSLLFDGIDDYISISNSESLNITDEITIEAWVYYNSKPDAYHNLISRGQHYTFYIPGTSNNFAFYLYNGTGWDTWLASYTPPLNQWLHLVATYNGSVRKIFINGVENNNFSKSVSWATGPPTFKHNIGGKAIGNDAYFFNGTIDEVAIYNRTLSAEEIKFHYWRRMYFTPEPSTSLEGEVNQTCSYTSDTTLTANLNCYDLNITNGANLTTDNYNITVENNLNVINGNLTGQGSTVTLYGNLTNDGSFNLPTGTLIFANNSTVALGATSNWIWNVTILDSVEVKDNGNINVKGSYNIYGILNTGGAIYYTGTNTDWLFFGPNGKFAGNNQLRPESGANTNIPEITQARGLYRLYLSYGADRTETMQGNVYVGDFLEISTASIRNVTLDTNGYNLTVNNNLTLGGSSSIGNLLASSGYHTIGNDLNLTNGTLDAGSSTINVGRNWDSSSDNATFNKGTSLVNLTGTGTLAAKNSFYSLTCGAAEKTTTATTAIPIANLLTIGPGTLFSADKIVYLNGVITNPPLINSGTLDMMVSYSTNGQLVATTTYGKRVYINMNGTATLNGNIICNVLDIRYWTTGTATLNTNGFSITVDYDLLLGHSSVTTSYGVLNADTSTINVSQDVIIYTDGSAIYANSSTWYVGRNWNSTLGTFDRGTSTVNLTGTGNVSTRDYTTNAFYNLKVGAAGQTTSHTTHIGTYGTLTVGTGIYSTAISSSHYLRNATTPLVNNGILNANIAYATGDPVNIVSTTYGGSLSIEVGNGVTATLAGNIIVNGGIFRVAQWTAGHIDTLNTNNFNITGSSTTDLYLGYGAEKGDGILNSGSSTIQMRNVYISTENSYMNMGTSSFSLSGIWVSNSASSLWDPGTSKVIFDSGTQQDVTIANATATPFYDVELRNSGTKLYLKNDTQMRNINISSGTELRIDSVSEAKNLTLYFSDLSGAGFDSTSAGNLTAIGNETYGVTITSINQPPTNYWIGAVGSGSMSITADYTTFSYMNRMWVLGTIDIDYSTFTMTIAGYWAVRIYSTTTVTSFTHNTFDNVPYGLDVRQTYTAFDNIVFTSISNTDISAYNERIEFVNSNFDITNIDLATSGNIISDTHNDIANNYKIMATTLSKSSITNDFNANDNVELINGTLTIDETAESNNFTINSGTTLTVNANNLTVHKTLNQSGTLIVTNDGNVISANSIIDTSKLTVSSDSSLYAKNYNLNASETRVYGDFHYTNETPQLPDEIDNDETGLVGLWHMNEGSGDTVADSSGTENDGTRYNMEEGDWVSGKFSYGLEFDGVDEYVSISDNNLWDFAGKNVTVSVWFKANPIQTDQWPRFFEHFEGGTPGAGWWFGLSGAKIIFEARDDGTGDDVIVKSTNMYNDSTWHHAAVTLNGTTAILYIDGSLDKTDEYSNLNDRDQLFYIGGDALNYNFNGTLDEFAIYNRSLSAAEIKQNYGIGLEKHRTIIAENGLDADGSDLKFKNVTINNSGTDYDLYLTDSNITAFNLTFEDVTTSLTGKNIAIKNVSTPPSTAGFNNVGKFLNVSNTGNGYALLNITYNVSPDYEIYLRMYRWTGSAWTVESNTGVNTTQKYVWANITPSSIYAPLSPLPATPTGPAPTPGTTGPTVVPTFTTDVSRITVELSKGGSTQRSINIQNTGETEITVPLSHNLGSHLILSTNSLTLKPGESKSVTLSIIAGQELKIITGSISISTRSIPVTIEVQSERVLFDAKMDITPEYQKISTGQDLKAQITLFSIGPSNRTVDVIVTYLIKDLSDNILFKESETFAVEKETSYVKTFSTSELGPGTYVAAMEVVYENSFATSSAMFDIVERIEVEIENITIITIVVIVISALLIYLVIRRK